MIQVSIEIPDLTTKNVSDIALKEAYKLIRKMKAIANRELNRSTAKMYAGGISDPYFIEDNVVEFAISGFMPIALEQGLDSFDMKPGMLGSPKAKVSKDGSRYITIPMKKKGRGNWRPAYSFRRVSEKSKPSSWIHPGFIANDFFEKATEELDY